MYLKPCVRCPRDEGCERRLAVGRALRSVGVNGATFKCEEMLVDFPPGMRVVLIDDPRERKARGTVMRHFVGKDGTRLVTVWPEGTGGEKGPIVRPIDLLRPTGQCVPVCDRCGRPNGMDGALDTKFWCIECDGLGEGGA